MNEIATLASAIAAGIALVGGVYVQYVRAHSEQSAVLAELRRERDRLRGALRALLFWVEAVHPDSDLPRKLSDEVDSLTGGDEV
jgi:hypothetical protein